MGLLRGLVLEIRPMPVIATMLAIYLAFLLSGAQMTGEIQLFFLGTFFLMYSIHFLDTYEDYYIRKEDQFKTSTFAHGSGGLLKKGELISCAFFCSLAFLLIAISISMRAGMVFLLLNLSAYLIGATYSRYLSRNPYLSILAAPSGVVLSMCSVYLLAAGAIDLKILAYSVPFFLLFLGAMTSMDLADSETDRKTGKPNLGLSLGIKTGKLVGLAFLLGGLAATLADFSISRLVSAVAIGAVFCLGFTREPKDGIPYVMGGILAFLLIELLI